jgi:hypothetical protein
LLYSKFRAGAVGALFIKMMRLQLSSTEDAVCNPFHEVSNKVQYSEMNVNVWAGMYH